MENKLPKGWVETDLLKVSDVITGKKDANFASENGEYLFFTCAYEPLKADSYSYEGDVLILPGNGANVGEVFYYQGKFEAYQRTYIVKNITVNFKFLYYYFKAFWKLLGVSEQYGSATNYIKIGNFKNFKIVLPPKAEQDRIVAKVDALMAQHAAIQQAMERIPQLLKDFRQQVLTQAVTGKLTEEWRVGKELGEWEMKSSNKVFSFITSGSRGWAKYYSPSGTQLFVRITNMNFGTFHLDLSLNKLQFLELPENNEGKRTLLKVNDILISITGDVGMVSLIQGDFTFEAYVNQHVCLARPNNSNDAKFISYYLMSKEGFGQFESKKRGATKSGLTLGDIRSLTINIPDLLEQQEIVRRVESLFEKATAIEQRYEQLKEQIDTLPQAILHKAFKGELVEQLDSDGSAVELLEEIKKLKLNSNLKGEIK
jgi:type I restriction enzyme S subunit